jgi:magnesium transporter
MGVTIHVFDDRGYSTHDGDGLAEVPRLLEAGARLWIETSDSDVDLANFFEQVLKLHPLAVEDILQDRPSPKVEDYGDYLYVVAHAPQKVDNELRTYEVDLVWNTRWILTHRHGEVAAITALREDLKRNPRPLERGPAFVAHAVLDRMVDSYLPIVDAWDDEVDQLESDVVEDPSRQVLQRIFSFKRSLQRLRRGALHQREVLHRLSRGEFDLVPEGALPFYRDVYDHFMRVVDLADGYRDLLSGALDAYLSVVSNRMNEVMKTLTLVATILLPMTFIVGVYGMNFDHMPELHWKYGYLDVWIVLVVVALAMLWLFRRRRWL